MKPEPIIKFLKAFDLNTYEAKCYLALLKRDNLSAAEVAKLSGVPRARVYEILDNLMDRGFCHLVAGQVKKFRAASPLVFRDLVEQKHEKTKIEIDRQEESLKSNIVGRKQKLNSAIEQKKQEFASKVEQERQKYDSEIKRKTEEFNSEMERKKQDFDSGIERKIKEFNSRIERETERVDAVIMREKKKFDSEAEKEKREIESLKKNVENVVETFVETYKKGRMNTAPLDYIEILREPTQIFNKFMQFEKKAQHEVCAFIRTSYSSARPSLELAKKYDKAEKDLRFNLLKKGVKYRVIYEAPGLDKSIIDKSQLDKETIIKFSKCNDKLAEAGEEAKTLPELPMVMSIWDSKAFVVLLNDPVSGEPTHTSLFIEHPAMAQSMKIVFEAFWAKAEDRQVWKEREHKKLK